MLEKISNLIDVKTVITFSVTAVFVYLSVTGRLAVDQFMIIGTMVYTYYFNKRSTEQELKK